MAVERINIDIFPGEELDSKELAFNPGDIVASKCSGCGTGSGSGGGSGGGTGGPGGSCQGSCAGCRK